MLDQAWSPSYECHLLLKAAICSLDKAQKAWLEWCQIQSIDRASWAEVRLLASVVKRIDQIDPNCSFRPKIEGVRRFIWARNQIHFSKNYPFLNLLDGIPCMLLKGAARVALNPSLAGERFMRDIDLLLPVDQIEEGVKRLLRGGMRPKHGKIPPVERSAAFDAVYQSSECEIDIHAKALRWGRHGNFDEELWNRACEVEWRGKKYWVPSASDQFIISIAHGMIADVDKPVDWVLDAFAAMNEEGFSWESVVEESRRRKLGVPLKKGVRYLREELGLNIPLAVQNSLGGGWLLQKEFSSDSKPRHERGVRDRLWSALSECFRSGLQRWKNPPNNYLKFMWKRGKSGNYDLLYKRQWVGRLRVRKFYSTIRWATEEFSMDQLKIIALDKELRPLSQDS